MPTIDDLRVRFRFDGAVKQSLQSHADNEAQIHHIEHHFIAPSKATLEKLGGCAQGLGFRISAINEGKDKGTSYWYFDVLSDRDTRLPSMTRESILMASLGEAFGAIYDGWGTLVEK